MLAAPRDLWQVTNDPGITREIHHGGSNGQPKEHINSTEGECAKDRLTLYLP
jgi:hypothetical protein